LLQIITSGDIDGDDDIDIIVREEGTLDIYILTNDGQGNFELDNIGASGTDFHKLGDVDNDNDLDIIGVNLGDSQVEVYYNNGNQGFQEMEVDVPFELIRTFAVGDINNDGNDDIVTANQTIANFDVDIRAYISNGNSFTAKDISNDMIVAPKGISLADINNDGNMDIVAINETQCSAWINQGNEDFIKTAITINSPSGAKFTSLAVEDMNGDDKVDIIIGDNSQDILWLENLGNNEFETKVVGSASPAFFLISEDLDLDGDREIIVSNGSLLWYDNMITVGINIVVFEETSIEVYPNPTQGNININSDGDLEDYLISVYNSKGENLMKHNSINSYLDVSDLIPGQYFLTFTEIKTGQTNSIKITKVN